MTQTVLLQTELQIAEQVAHSLISLTAVRLSDAPQARYSTVGPGARIMGIAVQRDERALSITIEVMVTMTIKDSIPALTRRIRQCIRKELNALTPEPIKQINIRIADIHLEGVG